MISPAYIPNYDEHEHNDLIGQFNRCVIWYYMKDLLDNFVIKLIAAFFVNSFILIHDNFPPKTFTIVTALGLIDLVVGLIKAIKNRELSLKKSSRGVIKVGLYVVLISVSVLVEHHFFGCTKEYGLTYFVSSYIIVNIAISIMENLRDLGVPVPQSCLRLFKKARNNIDSCDKIIKFPGDKK